MNISTTGLHSRQSVFRPYAKRVATLLTGVAVTMALTVPAVPAMAISGGQDNQYAEQTPGTSTGDTQGGETPDNQGAEPPQQLEPQEPIGVDDKTIVSTSKSGYPIYSDGTTEIPADVTAIGSEDYKGNTDLRIVVLPKSVIKVDANAFNGCTNLTDVIFPRGGVAIGNSAFKDCTSLKQVALYSNTSIGLNAFQDCTSLTQFAWFSDSSLGTGTSITAWAFSGCTSLREITVPESLNVIAANAFKGCTSLEEIHGLSQEKVEHWKTYAGLFTQSNPRPAATAPFKDLSCYASTSYNDDTITSISNGGYPIYSNGSAYIPNGVTTIGDTSFCNCAELRQVNIPNGVTAIGTRAFSGCTNLPEVAIPNGVTTIGHEAFRDCSNLVQVSIPDTVTTIGSLSFAGTQLRLFSQIYGTITSEQLRAFRKDNTFSNPFDEEVTIAAQPQEVSSANEATIDVTITDVRENQQIHVYDSGLTCTVTPVTRTATTQPKAEYDSDTNTFKVTDLQPGTQYQATIDNNALGCAATPATVSFTTQEETVIPDPTYTVTFDANGGSLSASDTIETNADGLIVDWPANPKRDGYEFDGWFTEDFIQVDSDTVFTEDTTVKAAWMKLVDVTWTNWNDSLIYTDNVREDATNTLNHPANPTRPEDEDNTYSFKGWSKSEDTNGNITYKATYNSTEKTKPDPLPEDPKPSDPANPGNTEDPNPGNEDDSGDAVNPSDPVDKGNSNNQGSDKPSDHKPITQDKPEQNQPTKQDPVAQDKATDNTPTNDSSQPNGEESLPPRTSDSASHTPLYMLLAGLVGLVSSVVRKKPTQD